MRNRYLYMENRIKRRIEKKKTHKGIEREREIESEVVPDILSILLYIVYTALVFIPVTVTAASGNSSLIRFV